jgi:hypothetical protein
MVRSRQGFDSVVLGDGTVLAVGDDVDCIPEPATPGAETAERFDPVTNAWKKAASLNKPRKSFATAPLSDGRAMVLGGINADGQPFSSTKIFDPKTGRWTDGPLLRRALSVPLAVRLGDGRVMALEARWVGETSTQTMVTTFKTGAQDWRPAKSLDLFVSDVLPLSDGSVVAQGSAFETPDFLMRLHPGSRDWQMIASPIEVKSEYEWGTFGPLAAVGNGDMLAFNVTAPNADDFTTTRVRRWDVATDSWTDIAPTSVARNDAVIASLPDGRVLVGGGVDLRKSGRSRFLRSTEIYDPSTDSWSPGPELLEPRQGGHAHVLADGSVLIFGGDADLNTNGDTPWCPEPIVTTERVYVGD